ncbi:glycosyl hydrolase 115 family protein [Paenibacillus hexagrammi]|uniref:Glycosyl hydrolase 115 family protein n=1 Tax=Paenibacillus hexagrammi TaxID=2908839 RepID=A0ABY3SF19_9BACL|nr:glycosyl hydrolase 115 family protein [Paenibacillus sp. YPD9-1]UJF31746.1 glycosyl hydrolase 115 family protein [Paenibacillus sp. YPD9-1]
MITNRKLSAFLKKIVVLFIAFLMVFSSVSLTNVRAEAAVENESGFPVFKDGVAADLYVSNSDYKQIVRAVGDLQKDIHAVTTKTPEIKHDVAALSQHAMIIGSVDESDVIKQLMADGKLDEAKDLTGKWESYLIKIVDDPVPGVSQALVIAGSDKRGAVYGIYDVSEQIGVSPWYYWADVIPQVKNEVIITQTLKKEGEPSVKYRGIFINDEENLAKWAALNDPVGKQGGNIGPETYKKIFELLLRLKANYIWPGMHSEIRLGPTDYFNKYPENSQNADDYGIVVGTSHCEPMMRNGTGEWGPFLQDEGYLQGVDLSTVTAIDDLNNLNKYPNSATYDYTQNPELINKYWDESVKAYKDHEVSYTLGMRGLHDKGFVTAGATTTAQKLNVLQNIVDAQTKMMEDNNVNSESFPIFIPYKEVLPLYEAGLKLPDNATIVWAEDNHGFIRRFPTEVENARSGGSGVYYHVSYVGTMTYIWLNSTPPALMLSEMGKAYESGAKQLWILNVGDLKPSEIGMDFFLDMAWNIKKWNKDNLSGDNGYLSQFGEKMFPGADNKEIGNILTEYYRLNYMRKPEHTNASSAVFDPVDYGDESQQRLVDYQNLMNRADAMYQTLPDDQKDSFYQLVSYPIKGSFYMNLKYYYAQKNKLSLDQGRAASANLYADLAQWAQDKETQETAYYNTQMSGGKWNKIMDPYPSPLRPDAPGMPSVTRVNVPDGPKMGVVVEGETNSTTDSSLSFSAYLKDTHFIDIFNKGSESFSYQVTADQPWVKISKTSGTVVDETRIFASIDWSQVPSGTQNAVITVTGAGSEKSIMVHASNPALSREEIDGYAEEDGYVSIEAEHYARKQNDGAIGFQTFEGLGRSGGSVATYPMNTPSYIHNLSDAPKLSYDVNFETAGSFTTTVYRVPTLGADGQRFAIGVDGNTPIVLSGQDTAEEGTWKTNVTNAIEKMLVTINIPTTGHHTIELYMIDAGVAIDKIVVNTGGEKPSNQGPPESYNSVYNADPVFVPRVLRMSREVLDAYLPAVEAKITELQNDTSGDSYIPDAIAYLKNVRDEVLASLDDPKADTVHDGYVRLIGAMREVDSLGNLQGMLEGALAKAERIKITGVVGTKFLNYPSDAMSSFLTTYTDVLDKLKGSPSWTIQQECYQVLVLATSTLESKRNMVDGDKKYLLYDDFNGADSTVDLTSSWEVVQDGGTINLETDPTESTNKYIKMTKNNAAGETGLTAQFPEASGQVIFEMKVRSDAPDTFFGMPYIYGLNKDTQLFSNAMRNNGTFLVNNTDVGKFTSGTWYNLKIVLDSEKQTCDFYVDGVKVRTDLPLRAAMTAANILSFYTNNDGSNAGKTGSVYIDNVKVYTLVYEPATEETLAALQNAIAAARNLQERTTRRTATAP